MAYPYQISQKKKKKKNLWIISVIYLTIEDQNRQYVALLGPIIDLFIIIIILLKSLLQETIKSKQSWQKLIAKSHILRKM